MQYFKSDWSWLLLSSAAFIFHCMDNEIIHACKKHKSRIHRDIRGNGCNNVNRFLPSRCKIWALNLAIRIFMVWVGNLSVAACFWILLLDFRRCDPEFMQNESPKYHRNSWTWNRNNSTSIASVSHYPSPMRSSCCWLPCNCMPVPLVIKVLRWLHV